MTALFKLVLSLPTFSSHSNNDSTTPLEFQLIIGFILCFSAENRAMAVRELSTKTINAFSGVLRERCATHISPKAVAACYYSLPLTGIELRDENHSLLNDETLSSLRYESSNLSIDEESARMILDGQQLRSLPTSSSSNGNNNSPSSSSNSITRNRIEVTEHWRSCNLNKMLTSSMMLMNQRNNNNLEHDQQRRVAILIGLVRFSVQSVLQAVIDLNESNMRNQQQYLNHENTTMNSASNKNKMLLSSSPGKLTSSFLSSAGGRGEQLNGGIYDDYNEDQNQNQINNNMDPNEKFISDNSPIDQLDQEDQEYYEKYSFGNSNSASRNNNKSINQNYSASAAAKRFLQGNPPSSSENTTSMRRQHQQNEAERILHQVNTSLYSEFDACIRLVLAFAEHFKDESSSTASSNQKQKSSSNRFTKDPRQPHLMMRTNNNNTRNSSSSSVTAAAKLKNPWDVKRVHYYDPKAWSIDAVHEGDLFYFSVHVVSLNANVLDAIVAKARSHYLEIKKLLAVTPQSVQNRRHFLTEMVTSVMPNAIALLQKLQRIVATQGEGHVQTALALCPELQQQQQGNNNNNNNTTIDCGNVVPVVEFLLQYFSTKLYSMGISNTSFMKSASNVNNRRGASRDNNDNNNAAAAATSAQQQQDVDDILASLGGRKSSMDDAFDDF